MKNKPKANIFDQELGKIIKRERTTAGLSQSKVAEHLNVSFQQVQKYEKGTNRISSKSLIKLALLLNFSIDEIVNDTKKYL